MTEPQTPAVIVLVRDLMFASRIAATARAQGANITMIREPEKLTTTPPALRLIVDLNQDRALPAAIEWKRTTGGEVVGFVSHVDADTIAAARAAVIDHVIPRSRFVQILPDLLRIG
jgi:hypothetical protein